jgi:hypothetical protein
VVQRPIEVVGDGQELAQQRLAGQPELALAVLRRAPLEVGKVGGGPLQRRQVLGREGLGHLELALSCRWSLRRFPEDPRPDPPAGWPGQSPAAPR